MKTVLLTGATGFLGSHLLEKLVSLNEYELIIIKRSFSDTKRINHLLNKNIYVHDIDKYPLENIFKDKKVDIIIHTATDYGKIDNSCYKVLETNLIFPIMLIEFAAKNQVEVFINTDSYFNKDNLSYSYLLNYSLSKKSLIHEFERYLKNV